MNSPTGDGDGGHAAAPTRVIALGASAGGLEALERFFKALPDSTGWALIVVQHLSPDFKSMMPELLSRYTALPIVPVLQDQPLRRDTVYVLTPGCMLSIEGETLRTEPRVDHIANLPINKLFESLASWGPKAAAIVLSGTGSDGTAGAAVVREAGGLVLAQTADTAKFSAMPRSVLETGSAVMALAPEDMPALLQAWEREPGSVLRVAAPGDGVATGEDCTPYARILGLLKTAYDIDFETYRPGTILRRIERRLSSGSLTISPEDYAERLASNRGELERLFSDLLIGVTRFFRDEPSFRTLSERAIVPLINEVKPGTDFRVWVCGCSTGEEAYSVAMLALQAFEQLGRPPRVRVLATDLHAGSLQQASAGIYTPEQVNFVPPDLRQRYFQVQPSGHYRVTDDLRRSVIFSPHNVLRDASFTRMDLVTCRNLLIYLQAPAQMHALASFHQALRNGGMLFLGDSESTGELSVAFEEVDRDAKLFRKLEGGSLRSDLRGSFSRLTTPRTATILSDTRASGKLSELLMNRYLPTSLLLNERMEVEHVFGQAGRYLKPTVGRFRGEITGLLDGALRTAALSAS